MTISVKPIYPNELADDPALAAAGYTVPSEFNAGSTIEMATARLLGRVTALAGAAEELTAAQVLTFLQLTAAAKLDADQAWTGAQRSGTGTTLISGTTITPTLADWEGNRAALTLGHNAVLANPTDLATWVGFVGRILGQQDATGGRTLSYGSAWKPKGAATAPALPTAANAMFRIDFEVVSATRIDFFADKVGV